MDNVWHMAGRESPQPASMGTPQPSPSNSFSHSSPPLRIRS